jgi:uncharacterized protein YxeA
MSKKIIFRLIVIAICCVIAFFILKSFVNGFNEGFNDAKKNREKKEINIDSTSK